MEFLEYPLLHYADLMLALLRAAERGGGVDGAIAEIGVTLAIAHEQPPVGAAEMRARMERARLYLFKARLVEERADGRLGLTARGRGVLAAHPGGVDDTVLIQFPEFRAFLRDSGEHGPPEDPGTAEYDRGYAAYLAGASHADNPHRFDTAHHLAWENGWFEARDEALASRHALPRQDSGGRTY